MLNEKISTLAMLVHKHAETKNLDVTTHSVIDLGDGQFTLGAGRAMTVTDKDALLSLLLNEESVVEFLDESILINSRRLLVWYRKPQVVDVPFADGRIKAPVPGLIFIAQDGQPLRCFSYKGKSRPTPDTPLFYAPFGNVYEAGTFCTGNAHVPSKVCTDNIPHWEAFVLDATNTHAGTINPVEGAEGIGNLKAFYEALRDSGAKTFPTSFLKPFTSKPDYANPKGVRLSLKLLLDGVVA